MQDAYYLTVQGTRVPALGLGTWLLEGDTCTQAVEHALEIGYRHIDTAQSYQNESEVGRGLASAGIAREEYFLTTKIEAGKYAPSDVLETTEESLRRLGVDYVDLLLIHWPLGEVPIEATLDAMQRLQAQEKTRHIGVSNFNPSLLQRALDHADLFNIQVEYHPFLAQDRLREMAVANDLMLTAYSPIARGRVTDNETLRGIADRHGKSPVQVTLRWLLQQEHVAAIPKAASAEHREANFAIFDFELNEEEMRRIHGLARNERIIDPDFAPEWDK